MRGALAGIRGTLFNVKSFFFLKAGTIEPLPQSPAGHTHSLPNPLAPLFARRPPTHHHHTPAPFRPTCESMPTCTRFSIHKAQPCPAWGRATVDRRRDRGADLRGGRGGPRCDARTRRQVLGAQGGCLRPEGRPSGSRADGFWQEDWGPLGRGRSRRGQGPRGGVPRSRGR